MQLTKPSKSYQQYVYPVAVASSVSWGERAGHTAWHYKRQRKAGHHQKHALALNPYYL